MTVIIRLAAKVPLCHDIFHEAPAELFIHIIAPGDVIPQSKIYLAGSGNCLRFLLPILFYLTGMLLAFFVIIYAHKQDIPTIAL